MQFQVPQFINIEDKIGPLTIKQYIYTVGGAGMAYLCYTFLPFYLALFFIVPIVGLAVSLAFVPVNGKPFIFTLYAAIKYFLSVRLYIWKRVPKKIEPKEKESAGFAESSVPSLSESKLKDMTWALDINQNLKGKALSNKN